ncbi:hypothetical protein BDR04DRAFT_1089132 [Suillus decipiens]|nr:hypothetical protein BDR04DRAFT_1089132 [Suillus decipiens]
MIYTSIIDGILKGMDDKKIEYPLNLYIVLWHSMACLNRDSAVEKPDDYSVGVARWR